MADALAAFLPAAALAHPAFGPLRPWLDKLRRDYDSPGIDALNALGETAALRPLTASGHPVRFCAPGASDGTHYEQRIFDSGRIDTRPLNLHDLFNALTWLAFPHLKAALNARHVAQLPIDGDRRGRLRDLLTLIDEGGVIVACAEESLAEMEALIRGFRWQALFWGRRAQVLHDMRFVLAGHAAYEKALSPYPGITCKAVFVATPRELIEAPLTHLVPWLDVQTARYLTALPGDATPRQMAPLPVFGYPGWLAENNSAGFYADRRWFRPGRAASQPAGGRDTGGREA